MREVNKCGREMPDNWHYELNEKASYQEVQALHSKSQRPRTTVIAVASVKTPAVVP